MPSRPPYPASGSRTANGCASSWKPWSIQFVEAVVHVLCTGVAWEGLPERFGKPDPLCRRYRRRAVAGIWDAPFTAGVPEDALETVMVDATITGAQDPGTWKLYHKKDIIII